MVMKVAFVTIGQTPRTDVVPEILTSCHTTLSATEFGVLDGLSDEECLAMAPRQNDEMFVSRLRSGEEIHMRRRDVTERLILLLHDIDTQGFDLIVLLCTGHFPEIQNLEIRTPLIEPQLLMDGLPTTLLANIRRVAIIVPNARQTAMHAPYQGRETRRTWLSPYSGHISDPDELSRLDQDLSGAQLIVMHCVGYGNDMKDVLHQRYRCPVLIPRRVISATIDLIST